jgi:CHASE2 domain-containing sensor protein
MNHSAPAPTRVSALRSNRSALATSKLLFFAAAGISFALSVWLWFSGDRERGLFVGIWVPSILSAGALLLAGGRDE